MTAAADRIFLDGELHALTDPDRTFEAVAVRNGGIVRLGTSYDVSFLEGTGTEVIDLAGRVLLPGFVDAHTHLTTVARSLIHADLSGTTSRSETLDRLRERSEEVDGRDDWILGFGYDESAWDDDRYLTREELDAVDPDRPVVAFREDMHVGSVNSVVLERLEETIDAGGNGGDLPPGVLTEGALDPVYEAIEPTLEETRELVARGLTAANRRGITAFHDMVRDSHAPRVYRELDATGELTARVRLNYWRDHLAALREAGLGTNHGSAFVRTGAIKTFTDGSFGGRTAKLSEPYADAPDKANEDGEWVVPPEKLRELVADADAGGYQLAAHAIGDEAIDVVLDAYESTADPGRARHRIEHAELASDEAIDRLAELDVVASVQPNFHKWAGESGLYDTRIGDRRLETNRFRNLLDAGVRLAFGSDGIPMDPLVGVHWAVNAPAERQRLSVTEALRAYTLGAAYAGFDEDRLGTIEVGKRADFVVLEDSPWERPDGIREIDVAMTVVDGEVVHDGIGSS